MRRVFRVIPVILTVCFLSGSVLCAVGAQRLERYRDCRMDPALMQPAAQGQPAALYVFPPEGRTGRTGTPRPMQDGGAGASTGVPRHIYVPYEDLPDDLIHAFVAIEDKRFFLHTGFDLIRTARAGLHYLTARGRSFGGSTLTQQLIKNLTGEDAYTVDRKLTEIFEALALERSFSKEEIIEAYLNVINLGEGCFGVGAAAAHYFAKAVPELTLAECACLAAVTNQPTAYDPVRYPENNAKRRALILSEMEKQGMITAAARQDAETAGITLRQEDREAGRVRGWYAELVLADVRHDLETRCGMTAAQARRMVEAGGLSVYTVMDEELQALLTAYYADPTHFPMGTNGRPQSSCIIIDPASGDVLAVAGAVGEKQAARVQNYAADTVRPAGSVIKPLSVYAPALERGLITWATVFDDEPVTANGNGRAGYGPEETGPVGEPWPRNADGIYRGRITAAEALIHSVNTVPVRLLGELGRETSFAFLCDKLHMESLRPPVGRSMNDMTVSSLALGQQSCGVTVRELTGAYTVFTEGIMHRPVTYAWVTDAEGRILLENKTGGEAVLSRENAAVMTHLLCGVAEEGTARGLSLTPALGIDVAGKTGTTQNNCDRWFVGYTPRLLCGVWTGYDYALPLDGIEGNPSLRVWDEVISRCEGVYKGTAVRTHFDPVPGVIRVTVCGTSGLIPTPGCTDGAGDGHMQTGWFVRGTEPTARCPLHSAETEGKEDTAGDTGPAGDSSETLPDPPPLTHTPPSTRIESDSVNRESDSTDREEKRVWRKRRLPAGEPSR